MNFDLSEMDAFDAYLTRSTRLAEITQRIGFTLWQLQELEGVAATCFVLLAQAKLGMGAAAGEALVIAAKHRTLGQTVKQLKTADLLSSELDSRLSQLLLERNWLVHSSRADSRSALYRDSDFGVLLLRLDRIAGDALSVLHDLERLIERHVLSLGITRTRIDEVAKELLKTWHEAEAD